MASASSYRGYARVGLLNEIVESRSIELVLAWSIGLAYASVVAMAAGILFMSFSKGNPDGQFRLVSNGIMDYQPVVLTLMATAGVFLSFVRMAGVGVFMRGSRTKAHVCVVLVVVASAMLGVSVQGGLGQTVHSVTALTLITVWLVFYLLLVATNTKFDQDVLSPLVVWTARSVWTGALVSAAVYLSILAWVFALPLDDQRSEYNSRLRVVAGVFQHMCLLLLLWLDGLLTFVLHVVMWGL